MFLQHVPRCSPTHCSSFLASSTSSVLGNIYVYPGTKRGYTYVPQQQSGLTFSDSKFSPGPDNAAVIELTDWPRQLIQSEMDMLRSVCPGITTTMFKLFTMVLGLFSPAMER